MKVEKRDTLGTVELRSGEGDELPAIEGYAAVYFDPWDAGSEYRLFEGAVERITRGAFDKTIKTSDVRSCYNHDESQLLGRSKAGTLELWTDDKGLRYRVKPTDTTTYRDVVAHMRAGNIDGSSFMFAVPKGGEEWRSEGGVDVRYLRQVDLFECGPVSWPAYTSATSGIRSAEDGEEARQSHESWKAQQDQERIDREKQLREIRLREVDDLTV